MTCFLAAATWGQRPAIVTTFTPADRPLMPYALCTQADRLRDVRHECSICVIMKGARMSDPTYQLDQLNTTEHPKADRLDSWMDYVTGHHGALSYSFSRASHDFIGASRTAQAKRPQAGRIHLPHCQLPTHPTPPPRWRLRQPRIPHHPGYRRRRDRAIRHPDHPRARATGCDLDGQTTHADPHQPRPHPDAHLPPRRDQRHPRANGTDHEATKAARPSPPWPP